MLFVRKCSLNFRPGKNTIEVITLLFDLVLFPDIFSGVPRHKYILAFLLPKKYDFAHLLVYAEHLSDAV
jgi:hypothetical protein